MTQPQILTLPVDRLVPYANNARTHSEEQVAQISASIREFGFTNPVLVTADDTIIAGHGRVMAARKLGLTEVPCLRLEHLTPNQVKAYVLADNRLAMNAGWDEELLKVEIQSLDDAGFDTSLLGFNADELDAFLGDGLEGVSASEAGALSERFGFPPFTVLNAREGKWQERKQSWLAVGIESEVGRKESLVFDVSSQPVGTYQLKNAFDEKLGRKSEWSEFAAAHPEAIKQGGTSIFDPVLTELCYAWFCPEHGSILDPFAGGSVRGIVAGKMGRHYVGVDLRAEQVEANRRQAEDLDLAIKPVWHCGDSLAVIPSLEIDYVDFVFSCPPYADLEVYSDDPADLSTMDYPEFIKAYREIIRAACSRLNDDAFACFVVGDVRDKHGNYRNFIGDTVEAFRACGLTFYNEAILVTAVGSLAIRVGRQFTLSRKLGRTHQNVLVFLKGDAKRATEKCGPVELGELEEHQTEGAVPNG